MLDNDKHTYWTTDDDTKSGSFEITLKKPQEISYILLQEYIQLGQRVKSFNVEVWENNNWKEVATATTIGYKRILKLDPVTTNKIRINIIDSKACPIISAVEMY
jgi:alpha-L-fucosidase